MTQNLGVIGDWKQLTQEAATQIMEGAAAYHVLKTERPDYQHWVRVGLAWLQLRNAAIKTAGLEEHNNPVKTRAYQNALRPLLDDERARDLREVVDPTRKHCIWLAENLAKVDSWMKIQDPGKRLALNHPTTIYRRHPDGQKADRAEKEMSGETKRRKSRANDADDAADRLTNVAHVVADALETRSSPSLALRDALDIREPGASETFRSVFADHSTAEIDRFAEALHSSNGSGVAAAIDWSTDDPAILGQAIAMTGRAAGRDDGFLVQALRVAMAVLKATSTKAARKPVEADSPADVPEPAQTGNEASAGSGEAPAAPRKRRPRTVALGDPARPRNRK